MVATKITLGKAEKSIGPRVLMATIMTTSANKMLSVNRISRTNGCIGNTSIVIISSMRSGTPTEEIENPLKLCRKVVSEAVIASIECS